MVDCDVVVLEAFGDITHYPDYLRPLSLTLFWLVTVWTVLPILVAWPRRRMYPLNLRPMLPVSVQGVGAMCLYSLTLYRDGVGRETFLCDAFLWLRTLFLPLFIGPQVLLLLQLYNRERLAHTVQDMYFDDAFELNDLMKRRRRLGWRLEAKVLLVVLILSGALIGQGYRIEYYGHGCRGCRREASADAVIAVFAIVASVASVVLYRRIQHHEDPLSLRFHSVSSMWVVLVLGLLYIAFATFDPGNIDATGKINFSWLLIMGTAYMSFVNVIRPLVQSFTLTSKLDRASRRTRAKARKDKDREMRKHVKDMGRNFSFVNSTANETSVLSTVSSDNNLTLAQVLSSKRGVDLFQSHLAQEFNLENIVFYKSALRWKNNYDSFPTEQGREDVANNIFTAFIPERAAMQINLSSRQQRALIATFALPESRPRDVFDDAIKEVFKLMDRDSFQRFQDTEAYRILNETTETL